MINANGIDESFSIIGKEQVFYEVGSF